MAKSGLLSRFSTPKWPCLLKIKKHIYCYHLFLFIFHVDSESELEKIGTIKLRKIGFFFFKMGFILKILRSFLKFLLMLSRLATWTVISGRVVCARGGLCESLWIHVCLTIRVRYLYVYAHRVVVVVVLIFILVLLCFCFCFCSFFIVLFLFTYHVCVVSMCVDLRECICRDRLSACVSADFCWFFLLLLFLLLLFFVVVV